MVLLDIVIGYYLPNIFGWLFYFVVILIEGALLSKGLKNSWYNKNLYITSLIANSVTTIIGFGIGKFLLRDSEPLFGHLISEIPIDYYRNELVLFRTISIFLLSFILTVVFEAIVYKYTLKAELLTTKMLIKKSIQVNTATYLLAALILVIFGYCILE